MPYQPWFERHQARLAFERDQFRVHWPTLRLDLQGLERGVVRFRGVVRVSDGDVDFEVIYPPEFPEFPPEVLAHNLSLDRHQNPVGKNLCTLARTVEQWSSDTPGAEVLRRAAMLVETTEAGPEAIYEAEEDAPQPYSTFYPVSWPNSVLVPQELLLDVPVGAYGRFRLRDRPNISRRLQALLAEVEVVEPGPRRIVRPPEHFQNMFPHEIDGTGYWYRSASKPAPQATAEAMIRALSGDHPELNTRLQQYGRRPSIFKADLIGVLFQEDGPQRGQTHPRWLVGLRRIHTRSQIFALFDTEPLGFDDLAARVPSVAGLREKHVLFVGLGTLGSRIVFELAESLLGEYTLIDGERLMPHNIVRHVCGLEWLGFTKVEAMEAIVRNHLPWARVHPLPGRIGLADPADPESSVNFMHQAYQAAESADLLVDATADHSVNWTLNRMARELNKPVVFAWVSAGAWGGHVLRYVPGETGCYECLALWRQHEPPSDHRARPVFTQGCGYPSFTGTSFDIGAAASAAARLTAQTLLRQTPGAYPDALHSGLTLANRTDQTTSDTPRITPHELPRHPACRLCQ